MRNEPLFLAVAILLHAGLPVAARVLIHPHTGDGLGARQELQPIEVEEVPLDLPEVQVAPPPPEPAPEPSPAAVPTPEPRVAAAAVNPGAINPEPGGPIEPGPAPTAAPTAPPGHAPGPDGYDKLPDDGKGGTLGVPGLDRPVWSIAGGLPAAPVPTAAPTVAPAPRPVDKDIAGIVIRDALRANDKNNGMDLPAAGSVASALRNAVSSGDTPAVARASFEVRLGPDGHVLGVRVSSFNGGTADVWQRAAQAAAAALAGRSLQMNEAFSKGGTVYVDISSVVQLPSGSSSAIRQQGAGASFDLSDIGAKKSRVVKASFRTAPAK